MFENLVSSPKDEGPLKRTLDPKIMLVMRVRYGPEVTVLEILRWSYKDAKVLSEKLDGFAVVP